MTQRKRARPGDILELQVGDGVAYLHYLGKHPKYGAPIIVSPRFNSRQVTAAAFSNGYVAFYPATVAVARGFVKIVGHLPPPQLPERLRRAGARYGNRVVTWIIDTKSCNFPSLPSGTMSGLSSVSLRDGLLYKKAQ